MGIGHLTNWLAERWVTGAAFIAGALVAVLPLIAWRYSLATQLIFLCSPAYMAHQVEEHYRDRFRQFVNQRLFSGAQAMTVADVLIINLPLVWGVNLLSVYMACFINPGYGLLAGYAMLVNGIGHILLAVKLRSYNPGLLTALGLFVPLGIAVIAVPSSQAIASLQQHLFALGAALAFHILIAVNAFRRAANYRNAATVRQSF